MSSLLGALKRLWDEDVESIVVLPANKMFTGRIPPKVEYPNAVIFTVGGYMQGRTSESLVDVVTVQFSAMSNSLAAAEEIRDRFMLVMDREPDLGLGGDAKQGFMQRSVAPQFISEPDGIYNAFVRYDIMITNSRRVP